MDFYCCFSLSAFSEAKTYVLNRNDGTSVMNYYIVDASILAYIHVCTM